MSRKQERIIALAVSLWIAGGGYSVALARGGPQDDEVIVTSKENADENVSAGKLQENNRDYYLASDSATKLTIAGGDYTGDWIGFAARRKSGDASGGTLTVQDGKFKARLYGGYSVSGRADNNTLIFRKGSSTSDILGGAGKNAAGNTLEMQGGEVDEIYGGSASSVAGGDSAELGNKVIISGGKAADVYGGYANDTARYNTVSISGSAEVKNVYGGSGGPKALNNSVEISGGTITGDIYGGQVYHRSSITDEAKKNRVTISGTAKLAETVTIYGGYIKDGNVQKNIVTIAQDNIKVKGIYGGYVEIAGSDPESFYGNVVNLNAIGIEATDKIGANIIKVGANVAFAPQKTVAKANDFVSGLASDSTMGTLDISAAEGLKKAISGTMTLLSSETANDFANLDLTYSGGTARLNAANASKVVYDGIMTTEQSGVTLDYNTCHTVSINQDGANNYQKVTYSAVSEANKLTFGNIAWQDTGALIDAKTTWPGLTFSANTQLNTENLKFTNPEAVSGEMTLLANAEGLTTSAATFAHTQNYSYSPLAGVMLNAVINGTIRRGSDSLTYTGTNNATKLTFTNVEWQDTGALIDHSRTLTNVSFAGADVDTTKINFTNIKSLTANKKMTLVKDFGDTVGNITGTEYTVGTVLKGKGKASLAGSDLIFTTETGTGGSNGSNGDSGLTAQEQTHNAVMGMSAGVAALSAGNTSIGEAVEGLGNAANQGADGVAVYAGMGGGSSRQETGSHVDSRTWNAILALGTKREQAKGTLEWGGFFEYGRSNYTLHSDAGRGDGHTHYTGGGVLAKWTNHHKTYIEASFRAGRMKDNAADIFEDAARNRYGYNVRAGYHGAHIGVGQVFDLGSGRSLDVYGKFFYNKRNGVSFAAGGQYDLDAVASKILRIGTRYSAGVGRNWNWYGGLAYEYELDGEATGKVTIGGVSAPIRAASTSGGSALAELGLHLEPTATSPWKADIGLRGSCGKHRGVGGTVSVAYMF